jgi:hypothetical protein
MLSKCSNPGCTAHFRYFHSGRLYRFDTRDKFESIRSAIPKPAQGVEFFWLCATCATQFTVVSDAAESTRVVLLRRRAVAAAAGL